MSLKEHLEALAEKYDVEVEEDSTELDLEGKELEELPECVCELTSVEELFLDKARRTPQPPPGPRAHPPACSQRPHADGS